MAKKFWASHMFILGVSIWSSIAKVSWKHITRPSHDQFTSHQNGVFWLDGGFWTANKQKTSKSKDDSHKLLVNRSSCTSHNGNSCKFQKHCFYFALKKKCSWRRQEKLTDATAGNHKLTLKIQNPSGQEGRRARDNCEACDYRCLLFLSDLLSRLRFSVWKVIVMPKQKHPSLCLCLCLCARAFLRPPAYYRQPRCRFLDPRAISQLWVSTGSVH